MKSLLVWGAILAATFSVGPAHAYRLSTQTLLKKTLKINQPKRVEGKLTVEYLHPALPGGVLRVAGTFQAEGSDRKRLTTFLPAGERLQVVNRDLSLIVEGDYRIQTPNPILDIPLVFWFYGTRQPKVGSGDENFKNPVGPSALERLLQEGGVNLEEVGLERIDRKICWRIGDPGPESAAFWMDRESYLPVKMSLFLPQPQDNAVKTMVTTRFLDWEMVGNGISWPRAIEIDQFQRTAWRLIWEPGDSWVTQGNPLPDAAFDLDHLRNLFPLRPETESPLLPGINLEEIESGIPQNSEEKSSTETKAMEEFEKQFKIEHNRQ